MSPFVGILLLLAAAPLIPLGITMFNLAVWRRGRSNGRMPGTVSVLIPARNEETNIDACLAAAQDSRHPLVEILVYDDASSDATADIVAQRAASDDRIRLLRGADLPRGWAGKSHACHRLAEAARGDVLLFIDADVRLEPDGVARLASAYQDLDAGLVTAVPRQETVTWAERLILPLLHVTYTSWLPLPLIYLSRDPRFLAANGQILSIRRTVYAQVGGFATVKDDVVEDMAFCRRVKSSGFRVVFLDGHHIGRCRMYTSARDVWDGFSKNLYRGLGANVRRLLAAYALYTVCFVVPYIIGAAAIIAALAGSPLPPLFAIAAGIGVGANVALRTVLAMHFRQPWSGVVTHPVSVVALMAIGINSLIWHQRGTIRWRGRTYGRQSDLSTGASAAHEGAMK